MSTQKRSALGQASRFALLATHSDSGEDEEWQEVTKSKGGAKGKGDGDAAVGSAAGSKLSGAGGEKQLSKSAKKRAARKRKNQKSASSDAEGKPEATEVCSNEKTEGNEEFQKDLEEAIVLSKLEAEQQANITEQRVAAAQQQVKSRPSGKGKKGVKLTLQQLHSTSDDNISPLNSPPSQTSHEEKEEAKSDFFEDVDDDLQAELVKEKQKLSRPRKELPDSSEPENVRVAQLKDELEKRDQNVESLKKENLQLKKRLDEVKKRNQMLCEMMMKGEFATKYDLLQQINELTAVKEDLTTEIQSLNSSLEQERTKNKSLKTDIAKLQATLNKK